MIERGKVMADERELLEEEEDTQKGKFMTFICDKECYGMGIRYVHEIVGIQKITEVPETYDYIKGLINLRGKIVPVIDVRLRFHKEPVEYNDRTCIIVTDISNMQIGLIVDTISGVCDISDADIVPPPNLSKDGQGKFIYGIGKVGDEVKLLIDPEKLISDDVKDSLEVMA